MNGLFCARHFLYVIVASCALTLSCLSGAAMYKSVDEKGNVTYSDKPPMKPKDDKTIQMRDVPPPGDPDAAKKMIQRETEFQQRANEREKTAAEAEKQQERQRELERFCREARMSVNQYRDLARPLYRAGENLGERVLLDSATREKEAARMEEEMKKAGCS
ncbi:MAG: DUF4124 domain-containing protein [Burkholderiales bacterium]|jgi:hypothetical protein|nr:DUF4124 domain-containing protein [Burkholderiales bacterium]